MATCIGAVVNFSRVACGNWSRKGSEQCRACEREEWANRGALPPVGCKWCQCGVAIASYKASCNPCKNKFKCNPCNASYADGTSQDQQTVRNGPYNVPAGELFKTDKWVTDAMYAPCVALGACSQGPTVRRIGKLTSWASVPFVKSHVLWNWWRMRPRNNLEHIYRAPCAAHAVVAEAVQIPLVGWLLPRSAGG